MVRKWLWRLGLLCFAAPAAAVDYLELNGFTLIDGTGAPARRVEKLLVRDGVIVAIDAEGEVPVAEPGARWTRIDLDGAWVMPGLIDTHVHVARFPDTRNKAQTLLRGALRGGVTAVRDLAGDARALADIERAQSSGELLAPDLLFSAVLGGPDVFRGGPTAVLSTGRVPGQAPWARLIKADSELPRLIAEARGSGVGNIKLYGDMSSAQIAAVIAEAQRQHLLTSAHATVFPARPSDLLKAGVGSLSHAAYLVWEAEAQVPEDYQQRTAGRWGDIPADHPRLLALYRDMAERGVFLDATLFVFKAMQDFSPQMQVPWAESAFRWGAEATRLANAAGVRITTGTDWFEPREEGGLPNTHAELALLVDAAGFTPMQAIVAATRNGAAALGLEQRLGSLEIGKQADLLVLSADPLLDIRHTQRLRFTVKRGVVIAADWTED